MVSLCSGKFRAVSLEIVDNKVDLSMAKSNVFTVAEVRALHAGKHCDGRGLWLYKRADGGAQWLSRFNLWGRQREMGLGPLSKVGLAQARQAAEIARKQVHQGEDPIGARRLERQ